MIEQDRSLVLACEEAVCEAVWWALDSGALTQAQSDALLHLATSAEADVGGETGPILAESRMPPEWRRYLRAWLGLLVAVRRGATEGWVGGSAWRRVPG